MRAAMSAAASCSAVQGRDSEVGGGRGCDQQAVDAAPAKRSMTNARYMAVVMPNVKLTGVRQPGKNEMRPGRRTLLHVRLSVGLGGIENADARRLKSWLAEKGINVYLEYPAIQFRMNMNLNPN